jgi:hypothetical protein
MISATAQPSAVLAIQTSNSLPLLLVQREESALLLPKRLCSLRTVRILGTIAQIADVNAESVCPSSLVFMLPENICRSFAKFEANLEL